MRELETGCTYKPLIPNFPLVDGSFVVEGVGPNTIVLLQVTKAKEHHTKRTTVRKFRQCMGKAFECREKVEKACSWEIMNVQHVDSGSIKKRWKCCSSGDAAGDEHLALWENTHQHRVSLNTDIASEFISRGSCWRRDPIRRVRQSRAALLP
ncbi:unnamed protein product [Trypanosoma congolense IL3000]|uniref:WGS project CAEQ00000000 data, annotated contig 1913 n=1 Tax=Trypanosoma congolense (strain IL3000) TaxID=1068625 RepID=F9WA06_TRYCI|nr:unnamed protein product [Trypanosoma congolense IL3000]